MLGINNRLEFYIACLWIDELDFYYYTRVSGVMGNGKKDWKYKRYREIIAEAKSKGAFN